jgi:hypothetical protein
MGYIGLFIFLPCIGIFTGWFINGAGLLKWFSLLMVFVSIIFSYGSLYLAINPYKKVFERYKRTVKEDGFDLRSQVRYAENEAKAKELGIIHTYVKALEKSGFTYSETPSFRVQLNWQMMMVSGERQLTCQLLLIDMVNKKGFLRSPVMYGRYFKGNAEQEIINYLSDIKFPLNVNNFE